MFNTILKNIYINTLNPILMETRMYNNSALLKIIFMEISGLKYCEL